MKLFLKILAGFLLLLILAMAGLSIYFTDDRLREMIVPRVSETLERDVVVDRLSITIFRTFPRVGLQMEGFLLPGADAEAEPVATFESLTVAVRIFPLLRDEISITRLDLDSPVLNYRVYADSTTNIDFLLGETVEEEDTEEGFAVQIPRFSLSDATLFYSDETSETRMELSGLDAVIGLAFSDLVESSVDATLQSLSIWQGDTEYLSGLSLQLHQRSTVNLEEELLMLSEATLSIRGFDLDLQGSFSAWSRESPMIDIRFTSVTDNFGELLSLAPPEFNEHLQGLESRGSLQLEGSISGLLAEGQIPGFELMAEVNDGYLRNPDLAEPIQDIHFALHANNSLIVLDRFTATASGNLVEASGSLENPFEEESPFTFHMTGDINLATISQFYPLEQDGIETLSGLLSTNMNASGILQDPEEASFNGSLRLSDGIFKYVDVPRPIENIEANIDATQEQILIHSASFRASSNSFSMSGTVSEPLAELPSFDVHANLEFDLATLKDFYPIDEDTLTLRGRLVAEASLQGQADQLADAFREGSMELTDGYIAHRLVNRPLENVTFMATAGPDRLNISEARFDTGENSLQLNGTVDNYMDDDPLFNLNIDGAAILADITGYYSLEPWISQLSGNAVMNLNAQGPAGDPTLISLNGSLQLSDVFASGDSLALPVTNLNGTLSVQPESMSLDNFFMNYGRSDFSLQGNLTNYLDFIREETEGPLPSITGSYHSELLDMDEMIDWEEERTEPLLIELPRMTSRVEAHIETLMVFGVPVTNIRGQAGTTPDYLQIENATAEMFDGTASGNLIWNVPQPDHTNLRFIGSLDDLQVDAFFREFPILGENSRFERHVTGGFHADVDYYTEMDSYFEPDITVTEAEGTFGMSRARIQGHPAQDRLAQWLGAGELRSLALDEWTATFTIRESVLTLNDFRLTSENIGIELDGTQHLVTDEIDFTAMLFLPPRFRSGLSSVLSSRVVDALTQDDGIIAVPLRISGTMESPQITPRESIIEDLIRDTGMDIIRGLFNRN